MSHPNSKPRAVLRGPTPTLSLTPRRDEGLPFRTLLAMAAVQISIGGLFLGLAWRNDTPVAYRAWAGAVIFAVAIVQGKLALKALKQQRVVRSNIFRRTSFWRTMFVGVVLSYLVALTLGPNPGTPYVFAAAVSAWYTLTLLPIAANPKVLETWRRISQKRIPRRTAVAVYTSVLVGVAAEASLQGFAWMTDRDWLPTAATTRQPPGFSAAGMLGEVASAVGLESDSRFHVAIVGDEVTLGGIHNDGALSQLEVLVPGVRVTNFSVPNVGPREYADDLARRVVAFGRIWC